MKKIIFLFYAVAVLIFLISMINGALQFYQIKKDLGNATVQTQMNFEYFKDDLTVGNLANNNFVTLNDYLLKGNPFEPYIQYNINVQSFNQNNPNFKVDYCNFQIKVWRHLEPTSSIVFEQNYTDGFPDIINAQYFFQLYDKDQVIAFQTCYYDDKTLSLDTTDLTLPMEMQMVMPTSECKKCQYYLWTKQEADVSKTKIVGNNFAIISIYIQKFIGLNFEIVLAIFWISLILMIFVGVGFIFIGVYWLFIYLSRIGR